MFFHISPLFLINLTASHCTALTEAVAWLRRRSRMQVKSEEHGEEDYIATVPN